MNLFTPERGENESRADYVQRRKSAKHAVARMTLRGQFSVHGGISSRKQQRDNARSMRERGELGPHQRFADVLMSNWARKRREAKQA